MSMKNSNGTIGNRTRDLPVCSTVPQREFTAKFLIYFIKNVFSEQLIFVTST